MSRFPKLYLTELLRHHPEEANLDMDEHGYVSVRQLIDNINAQGYDLNLEQLNDIVARDNKQRFRFSDDHQKIKACQGHTIPWVTPELSYPTPPDRLYHGTNAPAWAAIQVTGAILPMERHAVHMQAEPEKAWKSGARWHLETVLLEIDAAAMTRDGIAIGVSDNGVWCAPSVPIQYIVGVKTRID